MILDLVTGTATLGLTGALIALLLTWARARFPANDSQVVEQVNRLLPQTQCAQCGYPGCRPYAEAILDGAAINRCPPGGNQTIAALAELLGRDTLPPDPACGEPGVLQVAAIREDECIGCTLCIAACPVDAIFGAPQLMHTVIEAECTGCELCLPPCPVDCIDLVRRPEPGEQLDIIRIIEAPPADCIRCGRCETVCPRNLAPQELYWYRDSETRLSSLRLDACIECRLCDRVCPSELPLTQVFRASKAAIRSRAAAEDVARHAQSRYEAHQARQAQQQRELQKRPSAKDRAALLAQIKSGES
ncbi:MAG: electron transport complex subunit RsxB [Pseudomonadota bacterium]